eukprot:GHVL01004860.1.p1 GENE.GHVL01004860.1~~GHVL01004860.1.p1  ORF type:complete len:368 (-),score=81.56 GHVL01004860.1:10-1113(-)
MGHGIGRSGDLIASQPKAVGSSIIHQLTNRLLLHAIQLAGIKSTKKVIFLPVSTGLAMTMTLLSLKKIRKKNKIIWSRIDQQSCYKSLDITGCEIIIIELLQEGDGLVTDVEKIKNNLDEDVLAVVTTTSCFAPRLPDKCIQVAMLCKEYDVPHIVNNAYGLACTKICNILELANRNGRVDAFIQSADKNFMVPVGGCVIGGDEVIDLIGKSYPGRGSGSSVLDIFITLLSMGKNGWEYLRKNRKELSIYLYNKLNDISIKYNINVLKTPNNTISFAINLNNFLIYNKCLKEIGSMIFYRKCTGSRIILKKNNNKIIFDKNFNNWGAHVDENIYPYLTIACGIGIKKDEIDIFLNRLDNVFKKFIKI